MTLSLMPGHEPPLTEDLLRHEPFVRSLARRLVVDANDADDLVQQTWLKALQYPPRHRDGVRGWLALVLRNVASNTFQAKRRRADRERSATAGAEARSAPEIIAENHVQKRLASALDRLRPEYREVLRMRYFDGLPPRRIAPLLGVPLNTVYTRLRRGLVCMRSSMEVKLGRDRTAWGLVLPALLFGVLRRPLGGGRVPAARWAAASFGPAAGVAGIALAVLVAGWAALATERGPTVAAVAGPASANRIDGELATGLGAAERGTGTARAAVEAPAGSAALSDRQGPRDERGELAVRAIWSDTRQPARDAALRLERADVRADAIEGLSTDGEGRALALDLAPGTWTVRAERGAPAVVELRPGARGEVVLELPRGLALTAFASDASGAALPDAEVWQSWPGRPAEGRVVGSTDWSGRLALPAVERTSWLGVRRAGHRPSRLQYAGDPARPVRGELHFTLRAATPPLSGTVLDPEGRPIAGASIQPRAREPLPPHARRHGSLSMLAPREAGRSDGAGRFRIPAPGAGFELVVGAAGYRSALAAPPGRPAESLQVTLQPLAVTPPAAAATRRIHGLARDAHDEPLAGWRVVLEEEQLALGAHPQMVAAPHRAGRRSALTDAEGRFVFDACPERAHVLWLVAPGQRQPPIPCASARGVHPGGEAVALASDPKGAPSARLHGVLPGHQGSSVVLASSALIAPLEAALESETGHFAFDRLPPGEYTLSLWAAGLFHMDLCRVELAAGSSVDVGALAPRERGALRAQMRAQGGQLPARVVARLTRRDGPRDVRYPTEMNPDGELFFALLDPGDYTLFVEAPGMTPGSTQLTVLAGQETHLELPLELAFR